jgi:hypothetical protein
VVQLSVVVGLTSGWGLANRRFLGPTNSSMRSPCALWRFLQLRSRNNEKQEQEKQHLCTYVGHNGLEPGLQELKKDAHFVAIFDNCLPGDFRQANLCKLSTRPWACPTLCTPLHPNNKWIRRFEAFVWSQSKN